MEEWPSLQECAVATAKLHFLKGKQFLYRIKPMIALGNLSSLKGTKKSVDEVKQMQMLARTLQCFVSSVRSIFAKLTQFLQN